jgi:hypothetical protein
MNFWIFFYSERDHKPQNSGCVYTAQGFHTAWIMKDMMLPAWAGNIVAAWPPWPPGATTPEQVAARDAGAARTDLGDAQVATHPLHGVEHGLLKRCVTSCMRPVASR